jgi:hypothetical protein
LPLKLTQGFIVVIWIIISERGICYAPSAGRG